MQNDQLGEWITKLDVPTRLNSLSMLILPKLRLFTWSITQDRPGERRFLQPNAVTSNLPPTLRPLDKP